MENNISFNYLNLHTSYLFNVKRVVGDSEKLLDPIKSFKGRPTHLPCFANLFGFLSNEFDTKEKLNVSLGIFINADIKLVRDGRKNNLVVVNKDTIIRHLDYAKRMFDFEYQLNKRKNYYLRIQMIGNSIQVKFLCAWVRYLYEYPANVLMSDIYQLIDAGKFTDESIFNLIMALNSTLNYRQIRNDQCIFVWGKFQEEDELKIGRASCRE